MGEDVRRRAAIAPAQVGSEQWRQWWRRRPINERVLFEDWPPPCGPCRMFACVLWCEYGHDELGHPRLERWCRCPRCGAAWRDVTTIVGRDQSVPSDVEAPFRAAVFKQIVEAAMSKAGDDDERR